MTYLLSLHSVVAGGRLASWVAGVFVHEGFWMFVAVFSFSLVRRVVVSRRENREWSKLFREWSKFLVRIAGVENDGRTRSGF